MRHTFADHSPRLRHRVLAMAQLIVIAAALWMIQRQHPSSISWLPPCPTVALTDLHCPGCGSTRAVHHALNGRWFDAWRHNPAMLALGVPAAALYAVHLLATLAGRRWTLRPRPGLAPPWLGWALALGLVLFMVLRNLPGVPFAYLRPPPSNQAVHPAVPSSN